MQSELWGSLLHAAVLGGGGVHGPMSHHSGPLHT